MEIVAFVSNFSELTFSFLFRFSQSVKGYGIRW